MFFSFAVSWVLAGLDKVIKNPDKKEKYRSALLEIAAKIVEMYGQDAINAKVFLRSNQ